MPLDQPVKDEHYDLISILYHTLQGAETCETYISDARQEGDEEVVRFIQEARDEHRRLADKAKRLLAQRLEAN